MSVLTLNPTCFYDVTCFDTVGTNTITYHGTIRKTRMICVSPAFPVGCHLVLPVATRTGERTTSPLSGYCGYRTNVRRGLGSHTERLMASDGGNERGITASNRHNVRLARV